ncbi:serine hydrolase domain-containing protein [Paenibacillus sp. UNC451MF]|uniref:serine hydrolase domain-containing protein n=1 Tax=Paenibacillus sp. UNC451MF TaxID=1449063 RepID=UPI0006909CD2|nr:serine hydrolase [Paenibacillus sp. UNC451MF]
MLKRHKNKPYNKNRVNQGGHAASKFLLSNMLAATPSGKGVVDFRTKLQVPSIPYSNTEVIENLRRDKRLDYWPTDGWKEAEPEEHGMDSAALAEMVSEFKDEHVDGFVLIRDGYLVAEGYNRDWDAETRHPMFSVTKSVTSSLVGMAVDQDSIREDQTLQELFHEAALEPLKAQITVRQLLTMTSGIDWDNKQERSSHEMANSPDWGRYILERPMAAKPGTTFRYSNGNAHLLSVLVQKATGIPLSVLAKINLFDPMGITNVSWGQDPQSNLIGAWGLQLTCRDMAKFGLMYLHNGRWETYQVVPGEWVEESIQQQAAERYDDGTEGGFGYLWWLKPIVIPGDKAVHHNVFYAAGSGGQRIFVVPDMNMIMAITAANKEDDFMPEQMLIKAIMAVKSDQPLSSNDEGAAKLRASLQSFKLTSSM